MVKKMKKGAGKRRATAGAARKRAAKPKASAASKAKRAARRRPAAKQPPPKPSRSAPHPLVNVAGGAPAVSTGMDRSGFRGGVRELSWSEFDRQVQRMARDLKTRFDPQAIVGLVHGGVFVGGALASAMTVDFFPARVARRSRDTGHRDDIVESLPKALKGRRVLVVDDVAASGDSLELAVSLARAAGAKQVATLGLVTRPDGFIPDFTCYTSGDFFVFPWDYAPVVEAPRHGGIDPDLAGA